METQLIVRIDRDTKQRFSKIARMEGKTASTKVRELVSSYLDENDFSRMVGDLWDRSSRKLRKKGYTEKDVQGAIKKVRAGK
ncbi:MAG TPA: CopG family transcriptional regulator [Thermodesulfobacteriota bacterium]|nr:CopG family transcriptional regulator [Thermodesulfobacteriota bacterium]